MGDAVAWALLLALSSTAAVAGTVDGLEVFVARDRARAADVNANFDAVKTAVDDNDRRVDGLETTTAAVESRVDDLETTSDDFSERIKALESDGDADTLNGLTATDLVRAGHAEDLTSIDGFEENAFTGVVALSARAPVAGVLMIWGNLNAEFDVSSTGDVVDLECRIAIDGEAASILIDQEFARVDVGTNSGESIALSTVASTDPGKRSLVLECRTTGSADTSVFLKQRSLTSLFVPFDDATLPE